MTIYISSDHGGFELKNKLAAELKEYNIVDLGPNVLKNDDDFPDFAFPLASKVAGGEGSLGILICRSGNGMVIAANKVKGAYAALCFSEKHAVKAREDDNANILCLDADYGSEEEHVKIAIAFLTANFQGQEERFVRRFEKIKAKENENFC